MEKPWLSKEIIDTINNRIDELDPALRELSLKIHGTIAYPYPYHS